MSMSDDEDDELKGRVTMSAILEPEDIVFPSTVAHNGAQTAPVGGRFPSGASLSSKKQRKTKDWFPLKSFIDLQGGDDEMARWSWRSFIEVARVS